MLHTRILGGNAITDRYDSPNVKDRLFGFFGGQLVLEKVLQP